MNTTTAPFNSLLTSSCMVTGGEGTEEYVTEYHLTGEGNEKPLTLMRQGRCRHACGLSQMPARVKS